MGLVDEPGWFFLKATHHSNRFCFINCRSGRPVSSLRGATFKPRVFRDSLVFHAVSRAGAVFKILHRAYDRLPNPVERHLAPSIGGSVHCLSATASRREGQESVEDRTPQFRHPRHQVVMLTDYCPAKLQLEPIDSHVVVEAAYTAEIVDPEAFFAILLDFIPMKIDIQNAGQACSSVIFKSAARGPEHAAYA